MAKAKLTFRFKEGDVLEMQGARLQVMKCFVHCSGPAYEVVSPYTQEEPWKVSEYYLSTARLVRTPKKLRELKRRA